MCNLTYVIPPIIFPRFVNSLVLASSLFWAYLTLACLLNPVSDPITSDTSYFPRSGCQPHHVCAQGVFVIHYLETLVFLTWYLCWGLWCKASALVFLSDTRMVAGLLGLFFGWSRSSIDFYHSWGSFRMGEPSHQAPLSQPAPWIARHTTGGHPDISPGPSSGFPGPPYIFFIMFMRNLWSKLLLDSTFSPSKD